MNIVIEAQLDGVYTINVSFGNRLFTERWILMMLLFFLAELELNGFTWIMCVFKFFWNGTFQEFVTLKESLIRSFNEDKIYLFHYFRILWRKCGSSLDINVVNAKKSKLTLMNIVEFLQIPLLKKMFSIFFALFVVVNLKVLYLVFCYVFFGYVQYSGVHKI